MLCSYVVPNVAYNYILHVKKGKKIAHGIGFMPESNAGGHRWRERGKVAEESSTTRCQQVAAMYDCLASQTYNLTDSTMNLSMHGATCYVFIKQESLTMSDTEFGNCRLKIASKNAHGISVHLEV